MKKSDKVLKKVFANSPYNAKFELSKPYILEAMEIFSESESNLKMFLFARWIATCYADEHIDENMISQYEPEFNSKNSISVLNKESGYWWKKQLKHFNEIVYPNYLKNDTIKNTEEFLKDLIT